MKASELIIKLKEFKEAYGDLDVKRWHMDGDSFDYELVSTENVTISADDSGRDYIELF